MDKSYLFLMQENQAVVYNMFSYKLYGSFEGDNIVITVTSKRNVNGLIIRNISIDVSLKC